MRTHITSLAALLLVPALVAAQSSERASFYLLSGTDTILAERVTRSATELRGEFVDRMRGGRMTYVATLAPHGLVSRLDTRYFRTATDTSGDRASFTISGDTVLARMGNAAPAHVPAVPGVMPLINPSIVFLEQLLVRGRAIGSGRLSIPILIIGTPQPMAAIVTWIGADSATLEYAGVTMRFAVSPEGRIQSGGVPAQSLSIVRGPGVDALSSTRRDYSAPADVPYTAEEVIVRSPAGNRLSGTLTIPRHRAGARVPAVVTITGSGPQDRDGGSVALKGYSPYRELADTLGRRGIAVLRLDDRGVNGSDMGPPTVTSKDFADDIRAGVSYLRTRSEIDATRIGVVGHSEGAIIAPMVAQADGQLRAIVLMAGSASPGRDVLLSQQHYAVDTAGGLTGSARDAALARMQRATDSLAKVMPWMKFFLEYEPASVARQVETPVLILHGETDHQVPSTEAQKLAANFRSAGNRSVTVRLFPETNHLFVADATGGFDYAKLPSLRVRPVVLGAIADWLSAQFR